MVIYGNLKCEVVFNHGCFNFNSKNITMCMRDHEQEQFEVIRNTHENPELLK